MLIINNTQFIEAEFISEQELEDVVIENYEQIFGPSSIFLPKKLIKTADGSGTIPDGFAIDLESRVWYLMEAELAKHSVWSHIAPQVSKQVIAASQTESRKRIIELAIDQFEAQENTQEKFRDLSIKEIHVRAVLDEILDKDPIIAIPIDRISNDLKQWTDTLKYQVKLWLINKFVQFGNESNVGYQFPDEFRPNFDTTESKNEGDRKIASYDVSIEDLIIAGKLIANEKLTMIYKPKNGSKKTYHATIREDGQLDMLGQIFRAPSYAALAGIKDAGSDRDTVNGWNVWKFKGKTLKSIRAKYLTEQE
jgi:hypothetical protein